MSYVMHSYLPWLWTSGGGFMGAGGVNRSQLLFGSNYCPPSSATICLIYLVPRTPSRSRSGTMKRQSGRPTDRIGGSDLAPSTVSVICAGQSHFVSLRDSGCELLVTVGPVQLVGGFCRQNYAWRSVNCNCCAL